MTEKTPKIISLFNHKGGVSKTTTTFHLGWMLAELGHKVLLIDTDPQCNLTGLVLGEDDYQDFYEDHPSRNIYEALRPAFESQPRLLESVECVSVSGRDDLFLLPGHVNLSEYDILKTVTNWRFFLSKNVQFPPVYGIIVFVNF